jgi:hypothetical protein
VDANLEVIAEAWDGLIDVTAAIGAEGAGATALIPTPAEPADPAEPAEPAESALQGAPR